MSITPPTPPTNPVLPYPVAYSVSAVVFVLLVLIGALGAAYHAGFDVLGQGPDTPIILTLVASVLGAVQTILFPQLVLTPKLRAQQFMMAARGILPNDLGTP